MVVKVKVEHAKNELVPTLNSWKSQRGFWLSQDAENHIACVSKIWSKCLMSVKCDKMKGEEKSIFEAQIQSCARSDISEKFEGPDLKSSTRAWIRPCSTPVLARSSRFCWSSFLAVSEFQEPQELQGVMVPNPYNFNGCNNNKHFVTLIRTGFKREKNYVLDQQFWMERGTSLSPK